MKKRLIALMLAVVMIGTVMLSAGAESVNLLEQINQAVQNETLRKNHGKAAYRITDYLADGTVYSFYNYLDQGLIAFEAEGNVTIFENGIGYGFDDGQKRVFAELYLDGTTETDLLSISSFALTPDEVVIESYLENDQLVVHTQSAEEMLRDFLASLGYEYEGQAAVLNEYFLDKETYEILEFRVFVSIPGIEESLMVSEGVRIVHPDDYDAAELRTLVFQGDELRSVTIITDPDTENESVYSMNISKGCIVHVYLPDEYPYLYSDRACTELYASSNNDFDSDLILFTKAEA